MIRVSNPLVAWRPHYWVKLTVIVMVTVMAKKNSEPKLFVDIGRRLGLACTVMRLIWATDEFKSS